MRVLHVVAWDGGGVPTAMRFIAEKLLARGIQFDAFCFNGWNPNSRWADFCDHLYTNKELSLTELLVKQQYDVVQMIDTACPPPYDTNRWLKRAFYTGGIVCVSQNTLPELLPTQMADVFIACSDASRHVMAQTITEPIRVIPNGVDTARFYPRPVDIPQRPVLAWVGRVGDFNQKDIHGFLHLVAMLYNSQYDFWIADAGKDIEAIGLNDWLGMRVQYHSQLTQDEMPVFYSRIAASKGAVISTSRFEGLPFSLLEAAACGCPVIAPDAPGMEYIEDGKTGLLYKRENGLQHILKHLEDLKSNAFYTRITAQAHKAISDVYNSDNMALEYYRAYQDAVKLGRTNRNGNRMLAKLWALSLRGKRSLTVKAAHG